MRKINTLVLFLMFSACGLMQAQIYVNQLAFGSNDGSSWANAFNDLVPAIATSIEGDEIWVALGQYEPTEVIINNGVDADTLVTFLMDKNIKLYGGFVGNESSVDARNPLLNATILYGDANNDDRPDSLSINKSDNADHIIYATEQVTEVGLIDGFYIFRGGRISAQSGGTTAGGGIYSAGTPVIKNCLVQQCVAVQGGGLHIEGPGSGSVQIENCGFDNNYAIESGSCVKVLDVTSLSIESCRMTRSLALEEATLYLNGIENVSLNETVIQNNEADYYSAIYVDDVSNIVIKECNISQNHANVAMTVQFEDANTNANATFDQTRVINNTSDSISAGVAHGAGNLFLINSLFAGNVSGSPVIFSELGSGGNVSLNHSTLANISAPVLFIVPGTITTTNSIFHCEENGVFAGAGSITSTGGNICSDNSMDAGLIANGDLPNTNPELINVAGRNYKPGFDSPAKDAAVNSTETVDLDGELRDAFPDIGAFEITASATTQTEIDKTTIVVYPAVTEDAIKVNWESDDIDKVEYQIIDQRGALLQSGLIDVKHQSIDVSIFSAGQYQIIFTAEKQRTVRSFIKL